MDSVNTNEQKQQKQRRYRRTLFPAFVILVMIIIIIILLLNYCAPPEERSTLESSVKAKLGQLEGKSEEEIQAELNRVIEEGMFHVSINTNPVFPTGDSEGSLQIENVPSNRYGMLVEIYLKDTGELIYNSGLIEPNYHVQKDKLSVNLPAGDYRATAVFNAYTLDTQDKVGTASCEIIITVLY